MKLLFYRYLAHFYDKKENIQIHKTLYCFTSSG